MTHECVRFDDTFHPDGSGYGRRVRAGKVQLAHRMSYASSRGEIPRGMVVRHSCDNPWCVNPDHLTIGTQIDNIRDRVERGRCARGAQNARSRMSQEMVQIALSDPRPSRAVAAELGVSHTAVIDARRGRTFLSAAHNTE